MYQTLTICSLVLLLLILSALQLFAQQKTVSGIVLNQETNEPLQGVTVGIKGSDRSTITNEKGQFSINVSGNETVLKFSHVGFGYQEVPVGAKSSFSVPLLKDNKQLEDVVVVGYGTQKKESLTGAIATVNIKDIEDLPVT